MIENRILFSIIYLYSTQCQCSIENDPVFADVSSEEFVTKFVGHKMPAVANIANILLRIRDKELALQDRKSQLDELLKKQKINKLEPCKMETMPMYNHDN